MSEKLSDRMQTPIDGPFFRPLMTISQPWYEARVEEVAQLEAELETYRERHREIKDNFATIQRLRAENKRLREIEKAAREMIAIRHVHMGVRMCPVTTQMLDALQEQADE